MSQETKNILVTGAGSLLGQGLLRALSLASFSHKVFTADPDATASGHWLGDEAFLIPFASSPTYLESIINIIDENNIDLVLIGTDVELEILSEHSADIFEKFACRIVVSPLDVVRIADDKFLTAKFLKDNHFPFPDSVVADDADAALKFAEQYGYPLFSKPRDGARSIGIKKIENESDLLAVCSEPNNCVIQQYLPNDDAEYTSGCLVVDGKCVAVVTLRRDLRDGNTYRAYRDPDMAKFDDTLRRVAEALGADGPINFQFRIRNNEPVIFEINGRFSGTTPIRALFGFNEVEALLGHYLFNKKIEPPTLRNGTLMRTWSDLIVDNEQVDALATSKHLVKPSGTFGNFKLSTL